MKPAASMPESPSLRSGLSEEDRRNRLARKAQELSKQHGAAVAQTAFLQRTLEDWESRRSELLQRISVTNFDSYGLTDLLTRLACADVAGRFKNEILDLARAREQALAAELL